LIFKDMVGLEDFIHVKIENPIIIWSFSICLLRYTSAYLLLLWNAYCRTFVAFLTKIW
jgi:hypothetical protein